MMPTDAGNVAPTTRKTKQARMAYRARSLKADIIASHKNSVRVKKGRLNTLRSQYLKTIRRCHHTNLTEVLQVIKPRSELWFLHHQS